jgi:hypothetical protein
MVHYPPFLNATPVLPPQHYLTIEADYRQVRIVAQETAVAYVSACGADILAVSHKL